MTEVKSMTKDEIYSHVLEKHGKELDMTQPVTKLRQELAALEVKAVEKPKKPKKPAVGFVKNVKSGNVFKAHEALINKIGSEFIACDENGD